MGREDNRPGNIFATMKRLTCDNGCEFLDSVSIERSALRPATSRASLYFAHPYSAFERGANENTNRIIRRYIPKGSDSRDFPFRQIQAIEDRLNTHLPKKSLGGKTADATQKEQPNNFAARKNFVCSYKSP